MQCVVPMVTKTQWRVFWCLVFFNNAKMLDPSQNFFKHERVTILDDILILLYQSTSLSINKNVSFWIII